MSELVFCKLGGSIITDKRRPNTARPGAIERLAGEIAEALARRPQLRLVLGHGSGSFGHVPAQKYGVRQGIADDGDWWGYAETGAIAAQLNRIVTDTFIQSGVPVVSIQPSASAQCRGGVLVSLADRPIRRALQHGLVPLVYGDVAFDDEQGCTIVSTEDEFAYLASRLHPHRLVLVGQVDGVYDRDPLADPSAKRIQRITPSTFAEMEAQLGGSHGVDVTGGMLSKVREMVRLVEEESTQRVHLISGTLPGAVMRALVDGSATGGTVIAA